MNSSVRHHWGASTSKIYRHFRRSISPFSEHHSPSTSERALFFSFSLPMYDVSSVESDHPVVVVCASGVGPLSSLFSLSRDLVVLMLWLMNLAIQAIIDAAHTQKGEPHIQFSCSTTKESATHRRLRRRHAGPPLARLLLRVAVEGVGGGASTSSTSIHRSHPPKNNIICIHHYNIPSSSPSPVKHTPELYFPLL